MKTKIPHNVLTIAEMTKRPNRMSAELIDLDSLVLDEETIKKLRASSSMFNKTTYVQILYNGVKYNIESVDRQKNGRYRITLISTISLLTLSGTYDSNVHIVKNIII